MSQTSRVVFGAIAVSLTCGAVQFALGRDLSGLMQNSPNQNFPSQNSRSQNSSSQNSSSQNFSVAPEASINRAAKADRARIAESAAQTRTISLRLDGLSDTTVLVRIPAAQEARNTSRPPLLVTKPGKRKPTVACEPVVSVLTEVAKQLEPGRCVT
jgi:hypothetical protein